MPFSPRGIEQSLVLPPRWPLILYTGTLYMHICETMRYRASIDYIQPFGKLRLKKNKKKSKEKITGEGCNPLRRVQNIPIFC